MLGTRVHMGTVARAEDECDRLYNTVTVISNSYRDIDTV